MADFVASIDQGTTSTRAMIFNHRGEEVGRHQLEHQQLLPRAGWVEHNPGRSGSAPGRCWPRLSM
ncbi:Glycerol kinase (GlpK) [Mycobacteroides abscessus]|nr:Glycerol kinase (GlpK) [Mycobacteroides abscessus]